MYTNYDKQKTVGVLCCLIKQRKPDKIEEKYGLKRGRSVRYSTQKPRRINFDLRKSVEGSAGLRIKWADNAKILPGFVKTGS